MANSLKIMIVDDFDLITERLVKGLSVLKGSEIAGYSDDTLDAIEKYSEIRPDIMILDLMLKSGSGFDVLESIKSRPQSSIVIVFTYHRNTFIKQSCFDSGADYFLNKPNDFETLITLCNDIILKRMRKPMLPVNSIVQQHQTNQKFKITYKLLADFFSQSVPIFNRSIKN